MPYKSIDHTGDAGIEVSGVTLEELFANAARGLTDLITDAKNIKPKKTRTISLEADDIESLLHEFLSELLFLYDTERMLFSKFDITISDSNNLRATATGEPFNPDRHQIKTEVKAVTYHNLRIKKTRHGYKTTVIFDL